MAENQVNPWDLSLEQLSSLKKQHEDEIAELQSQLQSLNSAKGRFNNSKTCIDDISKSKVGDSLLVPLNSSLCEFLHFMWCGYFLKHLAAHVLTSLFTHWGLVDCPGTICDTDNVGACYVALCMFATTI